MKGCMAEHVFSVVHVTACRASCSQTLWLAVEWHAKHGSQGLGLRRKSM